MTVGVSAKESWQTFVTALNMRGGTGKLTLAKGLGLLQEHHISFIEAVARVRHRYAHNVKNMHRSLLEILSEEQPNQGRIVEHLTGMKTTLPLPAGLDINVVKWLTYSRLADFLATALHTLKPPPPPTGGLLGGLFGGTGLPGGSGHRPLPTNG
jgi:hypothetical protein